MMQSLSLWVSILVLSPTPSHLFDFSSTHKPAHRYTPDWTSLDSRPIPSWYDDGKIGIFMTWGVYSVPGIGSEWFLYNWRQKNPYIVDYMRKNFRPDFTYADFASEFKAELFNPDHWADVFKAAGASYVVLTTKHCEGFNLWPSKYTNNWNSVDVGPKKDLVGMLAASIRNRTSIRLGLYYVLYEWFHPLYVQDRANNWTTNEYVKMKIHPQWYELIMKYKPDLLWSDGDEPAPDEYWGSRDFLAWLYNESPVKDGFVTNDRWGKGCACHHGGYFNCMDQFNPKTLQKHKWENAMKINRGSWAYQRDVTLSSYLTIEELIKTLAETVSCGGNLLMDIGPTPDGRIIPIFEERLRQMGQWLGINGEGIYKTRPWKHQNDSLTDGVWYTRSKSNDAVFAIVLHWPRHGSIELGSVLPTAKSKANLLGYQPTLDIAKGKHGGAIIDVSKIMAGQLPNHWAWVLKLVDVLYT